MPLRAPPLLLPASKGPRSAKGWAVLAAACTASFAAPALAAPSVTAPLYRVASAPDRVYVAATLPNGRTGYFLVDTGAERSAVSTEVARELGLIRGAPLHVRGLGGDAEVVSAPLPRLWLGATGPRGGRGEQAIDDLDVLVGPPGLPVWAGGARLDGLLGADVWRRFELTLDLRRDRLTLRPHRRGPRTADARLALSPPGGDGAGRLGEAIALVTLPGESTPRAVSASLDTGSSGLTLLGPAPGLDGAVVSTGVEQVGGLGGSGALRRTRRFAVREVRLGRASLSVDLDVRWLPDATFDTLGLIGLDVVDGHTVRFDALGGWLRVRGRGVAARRSDPDLSLPDLDPPDLSPPDLSPPDLSPPDLSPPNRSPRLARRAAGSPRHELQAAALETEIATFGRRPDRALHRAWLHAGLGHEDDLDAELAALSASDDVLLELESATATRWLALRARERGDVDGALATLSTIPIPVLVEIEGLTDRIGALISTGDADGAWAIAEAALRDVRAHPSIHLARADALLARGAPQAALGALHNARALGADDDALTLRAVRARTALGDHDGAIAILRAALELDPRRSDLLTAYATLARAPELPLLRADVAQVLERTHPTKRPFDGLARAMVRLGDRAEATALAGAGQAMLCARIAAPVARGHCVGWMLLSEDRDLTRAETLAARAVAAQPNADNLDTLAELRLRAGDVEQAASLARRAAALAPADPFLAWRVAWITAAAKPERAPASDAHADVHAEGSRRAAE